MQQQTITVIGGTNLDLAGSMTGKYVPGDSIPGKVTVSCGGVAHNVALNLHLIGHQVRFVTAFGDDPLGTLCVKACREAGLDLSLSQVIEGESGGVYLCVNDPQGEMLCAVVDNDIVNHISAEFLAERMEQINRSAMVVADTNLNSDTLTYLLDHCTAPLTVDAVSTAKTPRIIQALEQSAGHRLHCLKLNEHEAAVLCDKVDPWDAVAEIVRMGVDIVYITQGSKGATYGAVQPNGKLTRGSIPAKKINVVNTTGAGDAFVAGIVHGQLLKLPPQQVLEQGQQAAIAALLSINTVNPEIKKYLK